MTEEYKLLKLTNQAKLRRIIQEIRLITDGELVVLFGSHSKGTATKNSDIDIYIETTNTNLKKEIRKISDDISVKIGNFNKENQLVKEIIKNHVIIQNTHRFYKLIK
jgi:predicted nucleotidyltransferase